MEPQPTALTRTTPSRSRTRSRFGAQGLVEFAVVGPVFLLMLFGVIEMGRLVWTNHELDNGTREGARYAIVHGAKSGTLATPAQVKAYMLSRSTGLGGSLNVNVAYAGTGQPGEVVTVTSNYSFQPLVALVLGTGTINLSSTSKVIVQH